MNWIIKFNQLEKENTDKVLDIIAKFDEYKNDILDDVYTKAYGLKHSIGNLLDKLNSYAIIEEKLEEEIERLIKLYIEVKEDYEKAEDEIRKYMYTCANQAAEVKCSMIDITSRYLTSKKDAFMFRRRMDVFTAKLINMSFIFDMDSMGEIEVLQENYWDLMTIKKIIDVRNKEYDDEQYELIKKLKESQKKYYSKIFDYRDMIDLAEKHEYKQVRQSGDHIIMQHKKTNKIVPIPAHELKYGLMLQIQKQIEINKVS